MRRNLILFIALLALLVCNTANAQYSGTKTIGVDAGFETVAAAITSINTSGIGAGGLTINVPADYVETFASPTAGRITATGTSSDPIVFQKSGSGANPVITAGIGTTTNLDGIIVLQGTDYITFDGVNLQESAGNITTTTQMEFGYALLKKNATAPFDGCQNITIKNCSVSLSRTNVASIGVWAGNHIATATTSLTITAATDANSNITVDNVTIQNAFSGVVFNGYASATPYALYDQNNTVKNCSITNYGGVTGTAYGIRVIYGNNFVANSNTIDNAANGGVAHPSTMYGIMTSTGVTSTFIARYNTITLNRASSTSTIYGLYNGFTGNVTMSSNTLQNFVAGGSSGVVYFIIQSATLAPGYVGYLDSNTIGNSTSLNATGSVYAISTSSSTPTYYCRNNTINGITRLTAASGTFYGIYNASSPTAGLITISDNTVSNITQQGSSAFYGIYNSSSAASTWVIRNNNVNNIAGATGSSYGIYSTYGNNTINNNMITGFTTSGSIYGIENGSNVNPSAVYENTIKTLSTSGASSGVYGIRPYVNTTSGVGEYYKNSVYDLSAGGASGFVYGISSAGGATLRVYNNLVSDLRAPASASTTAVVGLYFSSGTTIQAFYNSVYLNASSSGATFGSTAIYGGATTILDLRNNILVNVSVPGNGSGLAKTSAFRRSGATTQGTYYAAGSNNNCLYAGVADTSRVLYFDAAAYPAAQTIAEYKAIVAPKDANAFSENPPFLNVATTPYNLHINTTVPTQTESGGVTVSSPIAITTDFDSETRNETTPDVGADEYPGTGLDLSGPSILFTALANTSSTTARTLSVTFTDPSGVPTSGAGLPVLYWQINAGSWTASTATYISGNSYQFSFGAGVVTTDIVSYYIVAQDNALTPNIGASPSTGASGFTANPPAVSTPPSAPNTYTIVQSISGSFTVGSGGNYSSISAAITDISGKEVTGAVILNLTDANYDTETFPITFPVFAGVSASNTVTLKPASGVTVTLNASNTTSVIKLNGADYIIIDGSNNGSSSQDMTIMNHNAAGAAIWVASLGTEAGATYNTIKNCIIKGGSATGTGYGIIVGSTAALATAGADNDYLTITGNTINKAFTGILLNGSTTGTDNDVSITQNTIGSLTDSLTIQTYGINAFHSSNVSISQNTIQNLRTALTTSPGPAIGIVLQTGVVSSTVSGNKIASVRYTGTGGYGGRGLYVNTGNASSNITIANNLIYGIGGDGWSAFSNSSMVGIYLDGVTGGLGIYYNTIYMNGNLTRATATLTASMLLFTSTITAVNLKNNILTNVIYNSSGTAGAKNFAVYSAAPNTAFTSINYNDYYVSGTQGFVGYISSADVATLGAWQTATGQDANSISALPEFNDTVITNLQPGFGSPVLAAGTPVAGITTDYLGVTRSGSTPSQGAYENGADGVGPTITFTALFNTNSTANRTLSGVSITDYSNVNVTTAKPRVYFKKKTDASVFGGNTSTDNGWKWVQTADVVSPFSFTIDYAIINGGSVSVNDTVQYFIVAQDEASSIHTAASPSSGFAGTSVSVISSAPTTPNSYKIVGLPLAGTYTVGLTAFNNISGKQLSVERRTRNVEKVIETPIAVTTREQLNNLISEYLTIDSKTDLFPENESLMDYPFVTKRTVTVEEEYFALSENGRPYTGTNFAANRGSGKTSSLESTEGAYTTITSAITDLNERGVSGPVILSLTDNTYTTETFPLVINLVGDNPTTATNTLTIKPATGALPVITGSVTSAALVRIATSYVTVDGSNAVDGTSRDLSFANTATTGAQVVTIVSSGTTPITNVTLKNCNLTNGINTSSAVILSDGASVGTSGYYNTITIQNNSVKKAYIGIYTRSGETGAANGYNLLIANNSLDATGTDAVRFTGIYLQGADGAVVSGNTVGNFNAASAEDDHGIYLASGTRNTTIKANRIHTLGYTGTSGYGAHGIYVTTGVTASGNVVANNMISGIYGDGDSPTTLGDNPIGIYLTSTQTGISVVHNTVYLQGNTVNFSATAASYGIACGTGTSIDMRNNIIVNKLGLLGATGYGAYGVYLSTDNTQLEQSDYNNYVVSPTGSGTFSIGSIAGVNSATLAEWKTATAKDVHSQNTWVTFSDTAVAPYNLHLSGTSIGAKNLIGTMHAAVPLDYDGDTRNTAFPYMGADEDTISMLGVRLSLKAFLEGFYDSGTGLQVADTAVVYLRSSSFSSAYAPVDSSVTAILAANGTATVDFTQADFRPDSTYYIVVDHRNSIETWSADGQSFVNGARAYDFSTAANKAYGNNMKQIGSAFTIFSGDANKDNFVDFTDLTQIDNDSYVFTSGYVVTDLNGDLFVDFTDLTLCDNNSYNFIGAVTPLNSGKKIINTKPILVPAQVLKTNLTE